MTPRNATVLIRALKVSRYSLYEWQYATGNIPTNFREFMDDRHIQEMCDLIKQFRREGGNWMPRPSFSERWQHKQEEILNRLREKEHERNQAQGVT